MVAEADLGVRSNSYILNLVYGKPARRRWSPLIILGVVIVWAILLLVSAALEETLWHEDGSYDVMSTVDVTFLEDLFTISVVLSMGLILYFSLLSFDRFEQLFLRNETLLSWETKVQIRKFVNYRTPVSVFLFSLLFLACLVQSYFLLDPFLSGENTGNNWNGPGTIGGLASTALSLFLLLAIGPALAWRLLATTYLAARIIRSRDCPYTIPNAVISTTEGIGQVFRFAALTAAIPLVATPSLLIWLLTRGDLMIVNSIGSGAIIGIVALLAFIIPSSAVAAVVQQKKQSEIDSIDKLMHVYIETLREAGAQTVPELQPSLTDRMDSLRDWRDNRVKDPVWPYGWLAILATAVVTETVIAGLTSLF